MCGKRDDDTADAIEYFINRYRAEVLGHPVAFDEKGRNPRYTFVDDVLPDRAKRRHERAKSIIEDRINNDILPGIGAPEGVSFRFDGDVATEQIDVDDGEWHDVSFEWYKGGDVTVTVDGEEVDPPSITDMVDKIRRIRERRSFRRLRDKAATKMKVLDAVGIDDFRDLVERLRREGYGGAPEYDPTSWVDVTYDTSGTVFVCGEVVYDGVLSDAYDYDGLNGGLNVDGIPVLKTDHAPRFEAVLVDTAALVPLVPPFEPADPKDPRFEVRDPRGIAAIECVGGGR